MVGLGYTVSGDCGLLAAWLGCAVAGDGWLRLSVRLAICCWCCYCCRTCCRACHHYGCRTRGAKCDHDDQLAAVNGSRSMRATTVGLHCADWRSTR